MRAMPVVAMLACFHGAALALPPYDDRGTASEPRAALADFAAQLATLTGRWSDGQCARRWNDWSISGLDIRFHDQSGGFDLERVVDVEPGAFFTQGVVVSRGPYGAIWRYQPLNDDQIAVQNLTTRVRFTLHRCR